MAKWIKYIGGWINVSRIDTIEIISNGATWQVCANKIYRLSIFKNPEEADKFVQDFIAEHYTQTGKVG